MEEEKTETTAELSSELSCTCPDPALCKKLNKHISGRLWDIWQGKAEGLTVKQCFQYRQKWIREALGKGFLKVKEAKPSGAPKSGCGCKKKH